MGGVQSNLENMLGINQTITEAARRNDVEKIKVLLAAGANLNDADADGNNALHIASAEGNIDCVKYLLEKKIQVKGRGGFTALHRAVQYNQLTVARLLTDAHPSLVNAANDHGVTPLHWSGVWGAAECMKFLLEKGANANARQSNGQTPLHSSVLHSQLDCIKLLLRFGADVKIKDNEGNTALQISTDHQITSLLTKPASLSNPSLSSSSNPSLSSPSVASSTSPSAATPSPQIQTFL